MNTLSRLLRGMEPVRHSFPGLSIYERFEQAVVITLTLLIMAIVAAATWRLATSVVLLLLTAEIDPGNQKVLQTVFGMIFTVIIALEFKHSLLVVLTTGKCSSGPIDRADRDAGHGPKVHHHRSRRHGRYGDFRPGVCHPLVRRRLLARP